MTATEFPTTSNSNSNSNSDFTFAFSNPPIFLLKTKSCPNDGYEEFFRTNTFTSNSDSNRVYSFEPVFVPVLEHRFNEENLRRLKEYFVSDEFSSEGAFFQPERKGRERGRKYGGIIFTSQRAVEGFAKVVRDEVGVPLASAASHSLILYTVGLATSRALKTIRNTHLPHAQIYGEEAGTGEKLAQMILEHYNSYYHHNNNSQQQQQQQEEEEEDGDAKPALLFLVGEQRRDVIPKTLMSESLPEKDRIRVDELVVYETGEMESFESKFRAAVEAGEKFLLDRRRHRRRQDRQNGDEKHAGDKREEDEEDEDDDEVMWTVVFSPTGCDAMLRTLNLLPSSSSSTDKNRANDPRRRKCFIATIGPTTRDHLRNKYGVEPEVCAEKPTPEGVGKGIEAFMRARRESRTRKNK